MIKIPRNSKILSISHYDFDGLAAQIVLGNVFENIYYINAGYHNINDILAMLSSYKDMYDFDYVFLTDISPDEESLLDKDKIILLDHHETAYKYHNPAKMRFISKKSCGALLTKNFVEKYYDIKLSHLDELVKLANDYDLWIHDYPMSKKINDLLPKYWAEKYRARFFDGDVNLREDEEEYLKRKEREFKAYCEDLEIKEYKTINGCVLKAHKFVNDVATKLIDEENYEIVLIRTKNGVSVRRNKLTECINVGEILSENGWGGGYSGAGGFQVQSDNEFKQIALQIEKILYEKCPEIRR